MDDKDMIQALLEENEGLRNRITELEDELREKKHVPKQKKRQTNKRSWLDSYNDEDDD